MLETLHHPVLISCTLSNLSLFSSLPATSTSTTLHQSGLSTRKVLRCLWTQYACLQHHLPPSRYLATTSYPSQLHSSFCLRPPCSRGGPWRDKTVEEEQDEGGESNWSAFNWAMLFQVSAVSELNFGQKRTFSCKVIPCTTLTNSSVLSRFWLFVIYSLLSSWSNHWAWDFLIHHFCTAIFLHVAHINTRLQSPGAWTHSGTLSNIFNAKQLSIQVISISAISFCFVTM